MTEAEPYQRHPKYRACISPEAFACEIDACLEYVESDRFPIQYFAPYFVSELKGYRAWTAHGRSPSLPERKRTRLGWVIFQEFDEAGVPQEGEWLEMRERLHGVAAFFREWPTAEQVQTDDPSIGGELYYPRTERPENAAVAAALEQIVTELHRAGLWSAEPLAPEKMRFEKAFGADTMTRVEWLQFVFVPSVQELLAQGALPFKSEVIHVTTTFAEDPAKWPLIYAISAFDALF